MNFSLPSGAVNTGSAYFFADTTLKFGPLVKLLKDQTLIVLDYSKVIPTLVAANFTFTVDVSSNPSLVISYPKINVLGTVLTFLLSGGIVGQQYNVSVTINATRTDILTVNIPSFTENDEFLINPVPSIYSQLPAGTQGYVNTGTRLFWGVAPPANPNAMDQYYNTTTHTLAEWMTNGASSFWQTLYSPNLITEATSDGTIYARYNANWISIPIQADAPLGSGIYSRKNGAWVLNLIQADAPVDGHMYSRLNATWAITPTPVIASDAPSDNIMYTRRNSTWVVLPAPVIATDAILNTNSYFRSNGGWVSGGTLTGGLDVQGVVTLAQTLTVNGNTFLGNTSILGNASVAFEPISPMQIATKSYVDAHTAGGIGDAPLDGNSYGRLTNTWSQVLGIAGGTLTGGLTLPANPTIPLGAATKQYVDAQVAGAVVAPATALPLMDGAAAVGTLLDYARVDHVHPSDTSRYSASNPAGYQTAPQVATIIVAYGYQTAAQVTTSIGNAVFDMGTF